MTQFLCIPHCPREYLHSHFQSMLHWVLESLQNIKHKNASALNSTQLHASSNSILYCSTLWLVESQLSAHHTSINNVPEVITDAAISIVVADLHSALPHWWLCTIHQPDVTICACCCRNEIISRHLLSVTVGMQPTLVALKTHYNWSDFQEWIQGSKVCRCSCQQCCCTRHWHRYQYPVHIHQYLEENKNST